MTDPELDQIAAAQADTRRMMQTTLGSTGPTAGTNPIIDRFLAKYPPANRCAHLRAVPVQPSFLVMPSDLWRCRACVMEYVATVRLSAVEDETCDNCRRYLPGQAFTPFVFRQDTFVFQGAACEDCFAEFESAGATVKDV